MAVNSNDDARFKVVEYSPEKAEMIGYSNYSYWKSVIHNFLKKKSAVALLIVFVALVVFSFVALVIGKYDYRNLVTDSSKGFILPNSEFWFGTDNLGRDYWSQVWYATQTSIKLACIVAIGECVLGVTIGLLWGYVRQLDRFFTELYNVIDNIPQIIYMTLIALMVGKSFTIMAVSLIAFGWQNARKRKMKISGAKRQCKKTALDSSPFLGAGIFLRQGREVPTKSKFFQNRNTKILFC